jgi:hypothetical protein
MPLGQHSVLRLADEGMDIPPLFAATQA